MSLNQLKPELERLLPPTDSRFRPDVRQLEEGNLGKEMNNFIYLVVIIGVV